MAMPARPPPHNLLEKFRSDRRRLPLHPREKALLAIVAIHLCFLPWALGTMHAWSQLTSLGLAMVGFVLALLPRDYTSDQSGGAAMRLTMWPRLVKFPLFWIGLALLGYITLQASNPSWVWERNATTWWLRPVNNVPWLPTSIETPFERFNLWRQFIIYASAWLVVCTLWTGFTRRRALQLLLTVLVVNAIFLAAVGYLQKLLAAADSSGHLSVPRGYDPFLQFCEQEPRRCLPGLAHRGDRRPGYVVFRPRGAEHEKIHPRRNPGFHLRLPGRHRFSSPFPRGASIALGISALVFFLWFILRRKVLPGRSGNPAVTTIVVVVFSSRFCRHRTLS